MSTIKSSSANLTLNADGSGNDIKFQSNAVEKASISDAGLFSTTTVTATGVVTGATVEATGDTSAGDNAAIGYTATEGLILTGQGSTNDLTIKNDADTTVFTIPTGTDRGLSQFTAKAWINFNGTGTIAINDSHNVDSITDNGTGDYTVTYSTAMANANYSFALGAEAKGSAADDVISINKTTATQSASEIALWTVRVVHGSATSSDYDSTTVCVQVFGD